MLPVKDTEKANITRGLLLSDSIGAYRAFPAYFKLYESIFCPANEDGTIIQIDNPAFDSHDDIVKCAHTLRENPMVTREEFSRTLAVNGAISQRECQNAIQSVIRVAFMLDCLLKDKYSANYEVGDYSPARWEASEPFVSYVERAIPKFAPQKRSGFEAYKHKKDLKAWKLRKRCHLQFRPTHNIMEHLLYDPKTRTVMVFHHTAYLKAHLRRSKDKSIDLDACASLKLGILPPQLLVETLHTIQFILFPITSYGAKKSIRMLEVLVRKHGFDPNAELDEGLVREGVTAKLTYQYWNHRMEILYRLVKNPPPRNRLVGWIERHTSERNALTVAIIGLFLSALFGLLSCLIGGAQLVIAILAWKDPKQPA
ncbi:hypothetical protein BJY01DRAFT_238059 [Aspergillus pseudoustus]|uniref:Uncharacterized protein n=1 Tax=Aspergillus pseudoustus TaxID=1810923 RepID=A0ABR4JA44_9EURO